MHFPGRIIMLNQPRYFPTVTKSRFIPICVIPSSRNPVDHFNSVTESGVDPESRELLAFSLILLPGKGSSMGSTKYYRASTIPHYVRMPIPAKAHSGCTRWTHWFHGREKAHQLLEP